MAFTKGVEHLIGYGVNTKPTYVFGKSIEEAQEEWGGTDLLRMGSNENAYGTSPKALDAIREAMAETNRYPDPAALHLKRALAAKNNTAITNIAVANGSSNLMGVISRVFVCEGDEVIVQKPTFSEYADQARFNKGIVVTIESSEDTFEYDLDKAFEAVNDKTKLIWICNPNNPTGVAIPGAKLEAFIKKLPEDVITIIDEAYIEFADDPEVYSMVGLINDYNVIVMRTFAKMYGLGAMRIGYTISRKEIADCINAHITSFPVTALGLAAAEAALADTEFVNMVHDGISEGRKYLKEEFEALGWKVYPSQSNFMFVNANDMPSQELADRLVDKGIIIRGNFRFPRFTVGTMEENRRLAEACREINAEMDQ